MRLLSGMRNGRSNENNTTKSLFFYRVLKWILWLSISFYFFTSFLISHQPNVNKTKTKTKTVSRSKPAVVVSRALFESQGTAILSSQLKGLKVYVYDLPSKFNVDWLSNDRCQKHLFASEVAIHRALITSHVRTLNPSEADFFFVPIYVSCNFSTVNGFPAIGHARSLFSSAIRLISSDKPFWNRSMGSDHVFVASHDFGSCFHTMEDVAIADGVPEMLKKSIILQTFGVNYKHPCQDVENIVIPPYVSPASFSGGHRRDIFAFFRGKMEIHPKNISGRFYSKRIRTDIWEKYNNDGRFYLRRNRFVGYQSEIARSVFCLCPLGWAPWSPRLVESVALGCVPVIIADGIRLPFPDAVKWPEISLTVAERDVKNLGRILEHVAATNLSDIQRNLRDPAVSRALIYNDRMVTGDATWQVLFALANKLDRRSWRRRPRSSGVGFGKWVVDT